ncbi:DNA-binding transcriptional MerR regulator [Salirhabdus euzebyi]|uniref:DNA-binding transcriptional MerR regulator n=1 Tax=Salirhabdus euzebyi TaxID=394506 RepID=A0A841PY97_9BACI|nr:MerR family transcriptional regulator [Salirhabdus euzebyi]MBB6452596.1 DNA-binding transcriptional MerR regulator [Salirhabdus euzebyi]
MTEKLYAVKAFATLTGVTERTLRYYDRIGILTPSHYNEKGHRLYGLDDINQIQKILTLKYLGYSLTDIKKNLLETNDNRLQDTFKQQKEMLEKKKEEIDFVIQTITRVEKLVKDSEYDSNMLLGIIHSIQHEKEQRAFLAQHFSKELVDKAFLKDKEAEEREVIEREFIGYLQGLQELHNKGLDPSDKEVQDLARQIYNSLNNILTPDAQEELVKLEEIDEGKFLCSYFPKEVETFIEKVFQLFKEREVEGN